MTCLDMFVGSYQIASGYFQRTLEVLGVLIALKASRVFLELKVLGAFASGLGLNSFESCFQ